MLVNQTFSTSNVEGSGRANALAGALVRAGYQVSVIGGANSYLTGEMPSNVRRVEACDGYTVYRPRTYAKLHRSYFHRALYFAIYMVSSFWVLLRLPKADVIVGCSPPITVAASAYAASLLKRSAFVFEVRDLWPAFPIQMGVLSNPLFIRVSVWLERLLYRKARLIVINSPGFLPHLAASGVPSDRIRQVPNGVDVDDFKPVDAGAFEREELGLGGKFVVLYIGAHGPANALDRLLEVAAIMRDDSRAHFLLIGDGKAKPALVARAKQQGLENVTFLPPQPKNGMARYIGAADLCYASLQNISMFTTTYPNKVFDYMACGKAQLTTIDGVSREVIERARCGVFAPHDDPHAIAARIRWAMNHPDELREMGERGRQEAVEKWDRRIFASRFVQLIDDVVDARV